MTLAEAVRDKQILVVCGSGGVGKTSVAAALALMAARDRRTIVVTIDPAKRLASALGLEQGLGHAESKVDLPDGTGSLHAAMLDMKTAWDELIDRHAPSPDVARRIRSNRLYASLSEHFVGSQGYMAMEQLADLYERGEYELIVVDTPPTRSALDFLEAPKRMTDFIGGSLLRWAAKPYAAAGRFGLRAFNWTASPFLKVADRVLGSQVLEDLSALVLDFQKLYEAFKERAQVVLDLLCSPSTGFVVVTTPEGPPLAEAQFFMDRLTDEGLPLAGVIANKVVPEAFAEASDVEVDASVVTSEVGRPEAEVASTLVEARTALTTLRSVAQRDKRSLTELGRRARVPVAAVPLLVRDVRDLESLEVIGRHVLGAGSSGARGRG